jgi:hypothetical protein
VLRGGSGGTSQGAGQALTIAKTALKRVRNVIEYEASSRYKRNKTKVKLQLFRYVLDHGLPIPALLRNISVDSTLRFAEKEYVVPAPYQGEVLLFRATSRDPALDGIVNDTAYMDLFEDPFLGWEDKVSVLRTYDIPAGHSSTLREPNVRLVATTLQKHIDQALDAAGQQANG